jgi:site-specific recombinase XerD
MSSEVPNKFRNLLPEEEISGIKILDGKTPLWKYWDEFVKHYLREGKSEVTILHVKDTLKFVMRRLNIFTIESCNTPEILREALFKAMNDRNWAGTTLNTYRKNLNTYFLWLEDMEYIEENKIKKIRKCKEEQKEQYTLNEEQIRSLLGQIRQRRQRKLERWRNDFFIGLMVVTGARPCELLQLQCRDVQKLKDGSYKIVIRGRKQKGRPRYYRMPSWVRDSYEMYVLKRQDLEREEANLFVSSSKRTGWTAKGMRGLFKRLSKELGFKVGAYGIRRFVATKLNAEGVDVKDIMNHLGHTRISTTHRYIERSCCLTDKGVDVMGGVG